MTEKNYDSTIMRIAGNLLSGYEPDVRATDVGDDGLTETDRYRVGWAVAIARAIVAETLRAPQEPTP